MERTAETYRLWQHDVVRPKTSERTVILKMAPAAAARAPRLGGPAALSGRGRTARAVGLAPDSPLGRLMENGHLARVATVFDVVDDALSDRSPHRTPMRRAGSAPAPRLLQAEVAKGANPTQLANHLARMEDVEYAFVPPVRRLFARRSKQKPDPMASRQWAHGAIRLRYAQAARGFKDASNITVAVVDSGIDDRHPDLKQAIVEYKNFLPGTDRDMVGHGTHVSGIVAASALNGLGISGVCAARILALKALPRDGEEFDAPAYYRALRYVIGRAQVLNLSLGGERDPAEIDILRDVIDAGVVVVAAMGNEYEEGNPIEYPAAIRDVCAVGASDEGDRRATFSNTGRHIDLVAPGVDILSTTPTRTYDGDGERDYDAWDGTSMATPHVAAAAALVLARWPTLTPLQVIRKLTASADRVSRAKKGSAAYGAGRLNCQKALRGGA